MGLNLIKDLMAEIELGILVKYINNESTIKTPLGFVKSKLKIVLKLHAAGKKVSFSELELSGVRGSNHLRSNPYGISLLLFSFHHLVIHQIYIVELTGF
jgi:hypothetical protein